MNTTKQIQIIVTLVFLLVLGLLAYTMWEPTRAEDAQVRQNDEQLARGAKLFGNNCAICHGLQGEGFVGPALNDPAHRPQDPQALKALQAKLRDTITCGRVGTFMPAWSQAQGGSLNADQIRQLVTLITIGNDESWQMVHERAEAAHVEPTRPSADQINQGACGQVLKVQATPPPAVDPKQAWDIDMKDNSFNPNAIAVQVGQVFTLNVKNTGSAVHNLRIAGPDGRYDTADDIAAGGASGIRAAQSDMVRGTLADTRTYDFRCDFHPTEMTGTIQVK